jgi:hypothetical protein
VRVGLEALLPITNCNLDCGYNKRHPMSAEDNLPIDSPTIRYSASTAMSGDSWLQLHAAGTGPLVAQPVADLWLPQRESTANGVNTSPLATPTMIHTNEANTAPRDSGAHPQAAQLSSNGQFAPPDPAGNWKLDIVLEGREQEKATTLELGIHDVVLGQGPNNYDLPGNVQFRKLVKKHKIEYVSAPMKSKHVVAKKVVDLWRSQDPPGRFLKRENSGFVEVDDATACKKTSERLRGKKDGAGTSPDPPADLDKLAAAAMKIPPRYCHPGSYNPQNTIHGREPNPTVIFDDDSFCSSVGNLMRRLTKVLESASKDHHSQRRTQLGEQLAHLVQTGEMHYGLSEGGSFAECPLTSGGCYTVHNNNNNNNTYGGKDRLCQEPTGGDGEECLENSFPMQQSLSHAPTLGHSQFPCYNQPHQEFDLDFMSGCEHKSDEVTGNRESIPTGEILLGGVSSRPASDRTLSMESIISAVEEGSRDVCWNGKLMTISWSSRPNSDRSMPSGTGCDQMDIAIPEVPNIEFLGLGAAPNENVAGKNPLRRLPRASHFDYESLMRLSSMLTMSESSMPSERSTDQAGGLDRETISLPRNIVKMLLTPWRSSTGARRESGQEDDVPSTGTESGSNPSFSPAPITVSTSLQRDLTGLHKYQRVPKGDGA